MKFQDFNFLPWAIALILTPTGYVLADTTERQPVDYIDPFIGCVTDSTVHPTQDGYGKTFPGAATPYGLVQLSPDSITGGDNGSGYNIEHTTLEGFSFTHMSGVGWFGDLGNFMVMPTTGDMKTNYGTTNKPGSGYLSRKGKETARAGYYAVQLEDYKIQAEMTATPHSGILRFTFPTNDQSRIQIDLARRVGGTSVKQSVKVVGDNAIEGYMRCTRDGGGFGNGDGKPNYTVFFHAEFSKPLKDFGVWSATIPEGTPRRGQSEPEGFEKIMQDAKRLPGCREMEGKHLGFYAQFPTKAGDQVMLKAGISFVSIEGARRNVEAEIPAWDFDRTCQEARDRWEKEVSRITVQGGTECQRTCFYTAMYHAMIDPRAFADLDGSYPGGDGKIHNSSKYTRRTIFSGWDVYRSEYPLMTLIAPSVVTDMINSLTDLSIESKMGYLERWEFLNSYSGCMNGSPAVPVIADAYAKGLRDYDIDKVYRAAHDTLEKLGPGDRGYFNDDISNTLENNIDAWCLSRLAESLGKTDDAKIFAARSQGYRQIFNPKLGWFSPKNSKGEWQTTDRMSEKGCTESNAYQQGWFVPHDVPGMVELMGGREKFTADLTSFFEKTPQMDRWNNYYNHSNEPVHLIPFLFNRVGSPWLTQKWTRFICEHAYNCNPYGICGNDDVGQMSAWYVLASCGIHQACPGDVRYELFTPLFDRVEIRIDPRFGKDRKFIVTTQGNAPGERYIQSAKLNGQPLNRCWLNFDEITAGGTLELVLGDTPNKNWGVDPQSH